MASQTGSACRHCSTRVPYGRIYCATHYQAELVRYNQRLHEYENAQAIWDSLTGDERAKSHASVEAESTGAFAALFGLVLGLGTWRWLFVMFQIDGLYGVGTTLLSVGVCSGIPPLRKLLGRLTRATIYAPLYYAVIFALTWLASHVSDIVATHTGQIYRWGIFVAIALSLLNEVGGAHQRSAAPSKPSPPSP